MVENILELMKTNNINAKELTTATGLPFSIISEWKYKRSKPSLSAMNKIADYFGMSLDDLVGLKLPNAVIVQPEKTVPQEIAELLYDLEAIDILTNNDENFPNDYINSQMPKYLLKKENDFFNDLTVYSMYSSRNEMKLQYCTICNNKTTKGNLCDTCRNFVILYYDVLVKRKLTKKIITPLYNEIYVKIESLPNLIDKIPYCYKLIAIEQFHRNVHHLSSLLTQTRAIIDNLFYNKEQE